MVELVISCEFLDLLLKALALAGDPLLVNVELVDLRINLGPQFSGNGLFFGQFQLQIRDGLFVDVFLLEGAQVQVVLLVQLPFVGQELLVAVVYLVI